MKAAEFCSNVSSFIAEAGERMEKENITTKS